MVEKYTEGIGRRKTSTARVRIYKGSKVSTINGKAVADYFLGLERTETVVFEPLHVSGLEGEYYFTANVQGGGITGQLGAVRLGLARAIYKMDPVYKAELRKEGLVTRDPRAVERKKYNHKKARKKPQFSKR